MKKAGKVRVPEKSKHSKTVHTPSYFLGLFTVESWREFKRNGGQVMGFNEKKSKTVARIQPGDRILCYLSKVSVFVGVMEVAGPSYLDHTPIWSDGVFPVRLPVRIITEVNLMQAISINSLKGQLSFLPYTMTSTGWTIYVRSSPRPWSLHDGKTVEQVLKAKASTPHSAPEKSQNSIVFSSKQRLKKALPLTARVGRLIQRTEKLASGEAAEFLGSYDKVLSSNKVTGYSVNVPIAETCRPTAMCMNTCYFASGAPSWRNSLRHQRKVHASMKSNPNEFAERVSMEYDSLGLTFIRWNGGGDLFKENVATINHLGRMRPDITLWVVTRIPEWAAQIENMPNVFIHFSLDKHSLSRRADFLAQKPRSKNFFFSYQCDKGEVPPLQNLKHVSVLFFDNYQPTTDLKKIPAEVVCPLNTVKNITNVCESCRRCFNGSAVRHQTKIITHISQINFTSRS